MIRDFNIADETHVGYYVGLITSAFAVAQLMTGILWGMLSDRIGRRPVILLGLLGTLTSIILFGLSRSFAWAIISRSLCGVLNGNIGVLKSMVSEITLENAPDQRARAFSLLPLMYGLGSIVGPVLGGLLSHPVKNYPTLFGRGGPLTDFLTAFPYFLPCFISGCICAVGLIFGFFYLEETLGGTCSLSKSKNRTETAPLLQSDSDEDYNTFDRSSSPTPTITDHTKKHDDDKKPSLRESLTPAVLAICLSYALFAFQAIYYDELFPIWTASEQSNGGLGYRSDEIGIALAYCGVVTLVVQLFVLPAMTKRFGLLRLYRFVLCGCVFLYFFQGFIRYLYGVPDIHGHTGTKTWVWVGLILAVTFKTLFHTTAFTSCTILTNNCAPRLDALGAINGFAQCCASGMRAFGPASCGIIWSASLGATWIPYPIRVHVSWICLAVVGSLTFYTSTRLHPQDYDLAKFIPAEDEVEEQPENEEQLNHRA